MEKDHIVHKQGWIWVLSLFLFFFNSFLLPEGLTFTLLLLPLWVYILYNGRRIKLAVFFMIPLFLFMLVHLKTGVDLKYYLVSLAMIVGLMAFIHVFYLYANNPMINWDLIFRDIALLNFFLVMLAGVFYFSPVLKPVTWYMVPISPNLPVIPRLKLFTSEASHYSFWLAPIAIYFYARKLFFKTQNSWFVLVIITVPLILSFSMGVLAAILIGFLAVLVFYFQRIMSFSGTRLFIGLLFFFMIAILLIAMYKFPDNIVFMRLHNIISGKDTSARGRTYEAFILAHKIIAEKNAWFGIGPGQLKLIGRSIIIQYYSYSNIPTVTRIPNATAETMVYFGYAGLIMRFLVEGFFFFKTKVYANPYRFWLFVFVFIYQFTGSFITNPSEYIVWILVFSGIFPDFAGPQKQAGTNHEES